jgi:hypothetical protein
MVKFFYGKYNFRPLVGDTDGFNFAAPSNINDIKYVAKVVTGKQPTMVVKN